MTGYIYLIIDHLHNKKYCGQSIKMNNYYIKNYYGSGTIIGKILKSRGKIHLTKIILGYCKTQKQLNDAEREVIEFYHLRDPRYGYNLVMGGGTSSGWHPSLITKERISKSNKGKQSKNHNNKYVILNDLELQQIKELWDATHDTSLIASQLDIGESVVSRRLMWNFGVTHQEIKKAITLRRRKRLYNTIESKIHELNYKLISNFDDYVNCKSKITICCSHGHEYNIRADNFLHYDKLCRVCRDISS